MKLLAILIITASILSPAYAETITKEKPVKHMEVAEVTSLKDAKIIFAEKSEELKSKKVLDVAELQQIHVITYTLEKSIEYFTLNLAAEQQDLSKDIAVIVENIHINSENNRKEDTAQYLKEYFELAEQLKSTL
ncbi:DUF6746 family protein [Colwelliaceae bacterium MEBiC 14330]